MKTRGAGVRGSAGVRSDEGDAGRRPRGRAARRRATSPTRPGPPPGQTRRAARSFRRGGSELGARGRVSSGRELTHSPLVPDPEDAGRRAAPGTIVPVPELEDRGDVGTEPEQPRCVRQGPLLGRRPPRSEPVRRFATFQDAALTLRNRRSMGTATTTSAPRIVCAPSRVQSGIALIESIPAVDPDEPQRRVGRWSLRHRGRSWLGGKRPLIAESMNTDKPPASVALQWRRVSREDQIVCEAILGCFEPRPGLAQFNQA